MITIRDICERLDVTISQVYSAMYSGALPKPDKPENIWDDAHVEPFLKNWQDRINRRKEKHEN